VYVASATGVGNGPGGVVLTAVRGHIIEDESVNVVGDSNDTEWYLDGAEEHSSYVPYCNLIWRK
jgi:hypothetical protein